MKLSEYVAEDSLCEKKEAVEKNKPKSWLKTVSAFANGTGGVLIFGISDKDELKGLKDYKKDGEYISEIIKSKIEPVPEIRMENISEEGKNYIFLYVNEGKETPYYFVDSGNRIAYVRIGNESVTAKNSDLKQLILKGMNMTYDSLNTNIKIDNMSFSKLRSVYYLKTGNEFEESDFVSFGLLNNDKSLTNAGILFSDMPSIRHSRVFCTRWNGLDKASGRDEALDDKEFKGSLLLLLENSIDFIKNNSKKKWKKAKDTRIEMPDYPERAVQEAIVNALIHRDYTELGSEIHIDMFDDRMEIYSPGGMPDGSTVQNSDIKNIPSKRRNPVIADLFNRMNLMERRGSGLKKILSDYYNAVNYSEDKNVEFKSTNKDFWVILKNLNYVVKDVVKDVVKINDRYKRILREMSKNPDITAKKLSNILEVSERTVQRDINKLKSDKKIMREEGLKKGKWRVKAEKDREN